MGLPTTRRLIETPRFPAELVNKASAKEKGGGGRPEPWEMVFWWTRKPLASARAVLAAAALPADSDVGMFTKNLLRVRTNVKGEVENVPHRENPAPPLREVATVLKTRRGKEADSRAGKI
ncbi:MAG: DUF1156 domain-containing protein [Infirmifilum sp.]